MASQQSIQFDDHDSDHEVDRYHIASRQIIVAKRSTVLRLHWTINWRHNGWSRRRSNRLEMVGILRLIFEDTILNRAGSRAFALELPVAILGFVFVFITVQLPPLPSQRIQIDQPGDSIVRPQQKLSFDIYGAMALASFVATLVLALSMGGNDVPWSHPAIPTLLVLSGLSFVFFLIIERRTLDTPLVPLYLVVRRSIWPLFVITFFKDMAFMTVCELRLFLFSSKGSNEDLTIL